jgi:hypothetical protein
LRYFKATFFLSRANRKTLLPDSSHATLTLNGHAATWYGSSRVNGSYLLEPRSAVAISTSRSSTARR